MSLSTLSGKRGPCQTPAPPSLLIRPDKNGEYCAGLFGRQPGYLGIFISQNLLPWCRARGWKAGKAFTGPCWPQSQGTQLWRCPWEPVCLRFPVNVQLSLWTPTQASTPRRRTRQAPPQIPGLFGFHSVPSPPPRAQFSHPAPPSAHPLEDFSLSAPHSHDSEDHIVCCHVCAPWTG